MLATHCSLSVEIKDVDYTKKKFSETFKTMIRVVVDAFRKTKPAVSQKFDRKTRNDPSTCDSVSHSNIWYINQSWFIFRKLAQFTTQKKKQFFCVFEKSYDFSGILKRISYNLVTKNLQIQNSLVLISPHIFNGQVNVRKALVYWMNFPALVDFHFFGPMSNDWRRSPGRTFLGIRRYFSGVVA